MAAEVAKVSPTDSPEEFKVDDYAGSRNRIVFWVLIVRQENEACRGRPLIAAPNQL
jgi:hypothetical protein